MAILLDLVISIDKGIYIMCIIYLKRSPCPTYIYDFDSIDSHIFIYMLIGLCCEEHDSLKVRTLRMLFFMALVCLFASQSQGTQVSD